MIAKRGQATKRRTNRTAKKARRSWHGFTKLPNWAGNPDLFDDLWRPIRAVSGSRYGATSIRSDYLQWLVQHNVGTIRKPRRFTRPDYHDHRKAVGHDIRISRELFPVLVASGLLEQNEEGQYRPRILEHEDIERYVRYLEMQHAFPAASWWPADREPGSRGRNDVHLPRNDVHLPRNDVHSESTETQAGRGFPHSQEVIKKYKEVFKKSLNDEPPDDEEAFEELELIGHIVEGPILYYSSDGTAAARLEIEPAPFADSLPVTLYGPLADVWTRFGEGALVHLVGQWRNVANVYTDRPERRFVASKILLLCETCREPLQMGDDGEPAGYDYSGGHGPTCWLHDTCKHRQELGEVEARSSLS